MDVGKTAVGYFKVPNWRNNVALNFGALAAYALSCPTGYVCLHVGPDEFRRDRLNGALDARVPQAVNDVEDSSSPSLWDEGPSWPVADVDNNFLTADIDFFKVESRSCFA